MTNTAVFTGDDALGKNRITIFIDIDCQTTLPKGG
jgi:hypothetical protein